MDTMDKIAKDLKNEARQNNSDILYWYIDKLIGIINLDLSQLRMETGPQLVIGTEKGA